MPYINTWGPEAESHWRIAYDRSVHDVAAFLDDDPDGDPDFTRQSPQRQRACAVYGRCQVCARELYWVHRCLVLAALSIETVDVGGLRTPVVTEPWLCPDCAQFAVEHCPALIRRRRDEALWVVNGFTPQNTTLIVSQGWLEGRYELATRKNPVKIWAKLLLHELAAESVTR